MFANLNMNFPLWVGPFVCTSVTKNLISLLATGNENRRHISSMHICMYACMYVCMYACMYICMYACKLLKRGPRAPKRALRVPQELEGQAHSVQIFQYLKWVQNTHNLTPGALTESSIKTGHKVIKTARKRLSRKMSYISEHRDILTHSLWTSDQLL